MMQVEIHSNAASGQILNEGSGADVLNNFERLQFGWEDQNGNWDEVEFIVDQQNKTIMPEEIIISNSHSSRRGARRSS